MTLQECILKTLKFSNKETNKPIKQWQQIWTDTSSKKIYSWQIRDAYHYISLWKCKSKNSRCYYTLSEFFYGDNTIHLFKWMKFLQLPIPRGRIKMVEQEDAEITSPHEHIQTIITIHIEQLLLKLTWRLAVCLFYHQGCRERSTQSLVGK